MARPAQAVKQNSRFVPNAFQFPNIYVDKLFHLLTPEEKSVLVYMARRIYGFGKSSDQISLSQIVNGVVNRETGERLDHGAGLGKNSAQTALWGLLQFGIVVELSPPDYAKQQAATYALETREECIQIAELRARREEKKAQNQQRRAAVEAGMKAKKAAQK